MARYVDAEKIRRQMQKVSTEAWKMNLHSRIETVWNQAIEIIDDAPSVDVRENVHGEWVEDSPLVEECSKCGYHDFGWRTKNYNFCPNCGMDMRVVDEQNVYQDIPMEYFENGGI